MDSTNVQNLRKNSNANVLQIFAFALQMWVTIWAGKPDDKRNVFTLWQEFRSQYWGQIQMNTLNVLQWTTFSAKSIKYQRTLLSCQTASGLVQTLVYFYSKRKFLLSFLLYDICNIAKRPSSTMKGTHGNITGGNRAFIIWQACRKFDSCFGIQTSFAPISKKFIFLKWK